jgi:hypothetical protein
MSKRTLALLVLALVVTRITPFCIAAVDGATSDPHLVSFEEGANIARIARRVVQEWERLGIKNRFCPGQRSETDKYSDCTSFVDAVFRTAGYAIPIGSTYRIISGQASRLFVQALHPQYGDVMIQGGHAGIYVDGTQEEPTGANLACKNGPSLGLFGPHGHFADGEKLKFFRLIIPIAGDKVADLILHASSIFASELTLKMGGMKALNFESVIALTAAEAVVLIIEHGKSHHASIPDTPGATAFQTENPEVEQSSYFCPSKRGLSALIRRYRSSPCSPKGRKRTEK